MSDELHVTDLLPAFALDILTEEETAQVGEHLATCRVCQAELRAYQKVADELPLALTPTAPPPKLKDQLMRDIHSRQQPVKASSRPAPWQPLLGLLKRSAPAWGLALIVLLALGNWLLWNRLNQVNSRNPTPLRVVALLNTKDAPLARGTLIISQDGGYGTLVVDNLLVLGEDHQYQLWLIHDGKRDSGGVFSVNSDGYASLQIDAPQPLIQYQAIGITVEPAGGSPGPTGVKVLGGNF